MSEHNKESKASHFRGKVEFKVKTLNEKKGGCFVVIRSIKKMLWSWSFMYQVTPAVTVKNRRKTESTIVV